MKSVAGLTSFSTPTTKIVPSPFSKPPHNQIPRLSPYSSSLFPLKSHNPRFNFPKKFLLLVRASDDNTRNNGEDSSNPLSKKGLKDNTNSNAIGGGDGGENGENGNGNGNGQGPGLSLKWVDLLLNPDPDNVAAVGLTGVLAWASAQVLWQLFVISIAILLAALKYSFIAALLIFILITLL